jgi:hypothetical protein
LRALEGMGSDLRVITLGHVQRGSCLLVVWWHWTSTFSKRRECSRVVFLRAFVRIKVPALPGDAQCLAGKMRIFSKKFPRPAIKRGDKMGNPRLAGCSLYCLFNRERNQAIKSSAFQI